jgi:pimeloyl-ACP methyl ester carboxylesterase
MGGGDSFWPVIERIPEAWRVVLPDLPGCGSSEPLPEGQRHDVDGYVRWVDRFIQSAGLSHQRLVLASIATSAPVLVRYTLEHQDKVAGLVMHLPFLGKPAIANKWLRPFVAYALLVPPLRDLAAILRLSDYLMHLIILHEPPEAIPEMAERDIDHKQQGDLQAAGELLHDLMLSDARVELTSIDKPILILASEHDFSAPVPMLERIVARHPDRLLYVYRGGAHSWNEEFIGEMNREIAGFVELIV